jgi:regulator of protease activity HflC (stomatin/prohibitin superfamily)
MSLIHIFLISLISLTISILLEIPKYKKAVLTRLGKIKFLDEKGIKLYVDHYQSMLFLMGLFTLLITIHLFNK